MDDLVYALRAAGLDVDVVFQKAAVVSGEFIYDPCRSGTYRDRFAQKYNKERSIPINWRSLGATLNPQPVAFGVIRHLLGWIDRCDEASQRNLPAPPFRAEDDSPIFPPEGSEEELWWLTDVKRKAEDEKKTRRRRAALVRKRRAGGRRRTEGCRCAHGRLGPRLAEERSGAAVAGGRDSTSAIRCE